MNKEMNKEVTFKDKMICFFFGHDWDKLAGYNQFGPGAGAQCYRCLIKYVYVPSKFIEEFMRKNK